MAKDAQARERDSSEKLESDILNAGHDNSTEEIFGWLDRQAAITERHWMEICGANANANVELKCQIDDLTAENKGLQERIKLKDGVIEGLRQSLDETIAECNALADECEEWERIYDQVEAERDELQAKLDDFDGDCYCGATVVQWYDLATRLQDELDEIEQTHMRLPVDADGVPIRPGDMLTYDGVPMEVMAVGDSPWFDRHPTEVLLSCEDASSCRHVQPVTVESLLDEFVVALHELGEGADYGPTKERMAERIRRACNG